MLRRRFGVWKVWLEYWFRGTSRCVGGATRRTTDSVIYDSVAALYLSLFNGPSILRFFLRTRDSIHARIRALNLVFLTFCFLSFTRGSAVSTVSYRLRNFTGKQQWSRSGENLDGILGFGFRTCFSIRVFILDPFGKEMEMKLLMKFYFLYIFVMHRLWDDFITIIVSFVFY